MRLITSICAVFTLAAAAWTTSAWAQDAPAAQDTAAAPAMAPADTVVWGGAIYTADDSNPEAEAVAISGGRFVYVGNKADAQALVGPDTKVINLKGATLFPGFVDAHAHLAGIGERELTLNLEGTKSIAELKTKILDWRTGHPSDVLIGRGWIETGWPEGRFPTRWDLDDVIPDIPVILGRADGHAVVANSAALKAAGIDASTKPPFGGEILKNKMGEPTGMLIDAAQGLVHALIPAETPEARAKALKTGAEVYAHYGWTGLHNMSVPWTDVKILEREADAGDVGIRVYNAVIPEDAHYLFEGGISRNADGRIIARAIKFYMDGALGSRGAALLQPYSDADTSGLLVSEKSDVLPVMEQALKMGFQVCTHAIGDRGNRLLLDWYQEAFNDVPVSERKIANPRWRDEHSQIINPADIPRFHALGIIPSMQPSHAIGDFHFAPARLGEDRLKGAYAWETLIKDGNIVPGGSDAPVERGDPMIEFYAAVYRHDLKGFQAPDWHPEEAVTRAQALKMFTLWPAYASFQEDHLGSITVGKDADLSAFNINLMTVDPMEIPKGHAVLTMVKGKVVYEAPEEGAEAPAAQQAQTPIKQNSRSRPGAFYCSRVGIVLYSSTSEPHWLHLLDAHGA
ncbi:amidohydrolase [Kordiimonas marina]|uniref:amidohydrolase n=1 Tax=Kordiimonas marina TaxID=2872312 RepID=UPI001FF30711|nr:amidohydrolase [Kordiimonas marina]MCJ9428279.1 amidohydrolase [Kordiimonas marina]